MHIVFATPFGKPASPDHYRGKSVVQSASLQHTFSYAEADLMIVSKARNSLVSVLPPEADVVWFVDADIILPQGAEVLLEYVQQPTSPVVSGLYFSRQPPHMPQVYNRAQPGPTNFAFLPVITLPSKPFYADAVGAGCLLVQMDILRLMAEEHAKWQIQVEVWMKPWLARRKRRGSDVRVTMAVQRALELGTSLTAHWEFLEACGEDFYFCEQLRQYLDVRPLVVPTVECAHETTTHVTRDTFQRAIGGGLHYTGIP
jgi:hypothetical protein